MEDIRPQALDHGMTGVGPALIADDHIGIARQHVHDLAFSLVAPLGSDDHQCCHLLHSRHEKSTDA